ncbi:GntR family transcriptional regulator [Catenovulum sp. SM1970]|uniref:CvfB family protein n=1 Tax=Marinifaba aquimaris TaxID=2741323 RepID=UPI00157298A1|nr:S1-like domain-containing RNA-binding protein [Marinifaba aquimaris]NTS78318.1 GntR family transcriptional regulator [Marinifaba aquimaris]
MIKLGKYQTLTIERKVDFGFFLTCNEGEEVLLPNKYCQSSMNIGDSIEVFIYLDSEDRITAINKPAYAQVGDFVALRCIDTNNVGAFLDWGLPKDLMVPFAEQRKTMEVDSRYLVYVYENPVDGRIIASSKLDKFIPEKSKGFTNNQEVELLVGPKTDLGYKCVIENRALGILFFDEVFNQDVTFGHKIKGFIKRVRPDGKIDLSTRQQGYTTLGPLAEKILKMLAENGGHMAVSDKSSPELIRRLFACSKREFKMAIGSLYKQKKILLTKTDIELIK